MENTEEKKPKDFGFGPDIQNIEMDQSNKVVDQDKKFHAGSLTKIASRTSLGILLGVVLVVILTFNVVILYYVQDSYDTKLEEAKELSKPASIRLVSITKPDCKDCFSLDSVIDTIKQNNVNIQEELTFEYQSDEAKTLIKDFGITRIPTVLVFGETNKTGNMGLTKIQEALVLNDLNPVYYDLLNKAEVGKVSLISILDLDCKECTDISSLTNQLIRSGVVITDEKVLPRNEALDIINKYKITRIPTVIYSKDLGSYGDLQILSIWDQIGTIESDGSYVAREIPPPYYDLTTMSIEGDVWLVYLSDKTCLNCYNVSIHKDILKGLGVYISKESFYDVNEVEAKNLISKYSIKKIPTIILSNDPKLYRGLTDAWTSVGSVESDGTFVFRNIEVLGMPYKDLSSNKIIEPSQTRQGGQS